MEPMSNSRLFRSIAAIRGVCAIGLLTLALGGTGCGPGATSMGGDDLMSGSTCDGFNCNPNGCITGTACAMGLKCDPKSHTCVACAADGDCAAGQVCAPNNVCVMGCSSSHGCPSDGGVCEADAGMCVQ
jgi:Cys-rich repeat protein